MNRSSTPGLDGPHIKNGKTISDFVLTHNSRSIGRWWRGTYRSDTAALSNRHEWLVKLVLSLTPLFSHRTSTRPTRRNATGNMFITTAPRSPPTSTTSAAWFLCSWPKSDQYGPSRARWWWFWPNDEWLSEYNSEWDSRVRICIILSSRLDPFIIAYYNQSLLLRVDCTCDTKWTRLLPVCDWKTWVTSVCTY